MLNAAARLLTSTRRRDHITPVLRQLHWLPVQRRVEFKIACLVHQSLASTAPTYLSADIRLISEHGRPHLRSSSHRTLVVPPTCTSFGDRSFAAAGPRLWNTLPSTLRQMTSYGQFRRHLKAYLFRQESRRIVTFDFCAIQIPLLTYLLTHSICQNISISILFLVTKLSGSYHNIQFSFNCHASNSFQFYLSLPHDLLSSATAILDISSHKHELTLTFSLNESTLPPVNKVIN